MGSVRLLAAPDLFTPDVRSMNFDLLINTLVLRCVTDDSGQDVVEYALLGALVGISSILTWQLLATTVGNVYSAVDGDVQNVSACTPNPGGGGCP